MTQPSPQVNVTGTMVLVRDIVAAALSAEGVSCRVLSADAVPSPADPIIVVCGGEEDFTVCIGELGQSIADSRMLVLTKNPFELPENLDGHVQSWSCSIRELIEELDAPGGSHSGVSRTKPDPGAILTTREQEVLRHLARATAADKIAVAMSISPHTVRTHIQNLLAKLNATSRLEAVAEGRRLGLIGEVRGDGR